MPLIALSTGTNNAFPVMVEATAAGMAAALVASHMVDIESVSSVSKVVPVDIHGEHPDLALIDAVVTSDRFLGSRALTDVAALEFAVVSSADASRVGISGLAGCVHPIGPDDDTGLLLEFGRDSDSDHSTEVVAPLAPVILRNVQLSNYQVIQLGDSVSHTSKGVLASDGERERILKADQRVSFTLKRNGPKVIDIAHALNVAAQNGRFVRVWV